MCGIVGYVGQRPAVPIVLEGLSQLVYRGYDSAGISGIIAPGKLKIVKQVLPEGKFKAFATAVEASNFPEACTNAIGHTRWATHGGRTEINAHPHCDGSGQIAVVHNGMLENWRELKAELESLGCRIISETDTELIAHLFALKLQETKGDIRQAVLSTVTSLQGAFGILLQYARYPDLLIGIRQGSPLSYAKLDDGAFMIASTGDPFLPYTRHCKHLRDGDVVIIHRGEVEEFSFRNGGYDPVTIPSVVLEGSVEDVSREGYPHFMLKEIMTQPERLPDVLRGRLDLETGLVKLGGLEASPRARQKLRHAKHFWFVASGTSYHAAQIIARMFRERLQVHAEAKQASEVVLDDILSGCNASRSVVFAISQSGETKDLLVAVEHLKTKGVGLVVGIVNVVGSTLVTLTDKAGVYLRVGPEIGVASTKAFSSQVLVGAMITVWLAQKRGLPSDQAIRFVRAIAQVPEQLKVVLAQSDAIRELAKYIKGFTSLMILGRGYHYATAQEGGLKVAEVSYLAREVQPAGEMKHGPIALVTEGYPVVIVATRDSSRQAIMHNISELQARGAFVIGIITDGDTEMAGIVNKAIFIPDAPPELATILAAAALQLLAYYLGVLKGYNVDQPRNLAKAVTVE